MNVNSCWCWSWWSRRHNDPAGPKRVFSNSGSAFSQRDDGPDRHHHHPSPLQDQMITKVLQERLIMKHERKRGERKLFRPQGSETPPIITARTPLYRRVHQCHGIDNAQYVCVLQPSETLRLAKLFRNISESECYQQSSYQGCPEKPNCHAEKGPIHRKIVVDCPLVITSKVKSFSRPYNSRKEE